MEIKSIKEIKNIGTFADFTNGGCLGFEKLTFIYGGNTFGKTTLSDIFQSLKYNNADLLKNRKTIPNQNGTQKTIFKIKINGTEKNIKYDNHIWFIDDSSINEENKENIKKDFQDNLEVFGSEFIYKNLFTGYSIERENRVNFTEFILGEEGVTLAEQIEADKKLLGEKNKILKNIIPKFIQLKTDKEKQEFLDFKINELNKEEIYIKLGKYKSEKDVFQDPQKILGIEDLSNIKIPEYTILDNIKNINQLLQKDYTDLKEEFLQKLNNHIASNFINNENSENWIKDGYKNIKNKNGNCIFCGQTLKNAKDMIDLYDKYFDENYSKFISEIEEKLELEISNIEKINFNLLSNIQNQYTISLKYKDLIIDDNFQEYLISFEQKIKEIKESELNEIKKIFITMAKRGILEKNKKPYKKIDEIDFSDLKTKFNNYTNSILEIMEIINFIIIKITELKEQYKDATKISKNIKDLELKISKGEFLKSRIELDGECNKYLLEQKEVIELSGKIEQNIEKLKIDQNQYLEKYFESINILFDRFGSHNFTLEKDEDNKGHKPVYSLKVKFHGKEISSTQMQTVFSESDRRALALAIFWTKIELKEEDKRKNTIVILDDPITSFDNERTKVFIDYLRDNYNNISQLIILTHYSKFLSDYYLFTENKPKVHKIVKGGKLEEFDYDYFLKSDYSKIYDEIKSFINDGGKIEPAKLRSFIEKLYIPIFKNIIPKVIIDDCRSKCCTYNHNNFNNDSDIENFRNFTKTIFEKLYSVEYKN